MLEIGLGAGTGPTPGESGHQFVNDYHGRLRVPSTPLGHSFGELVSRSQCQRWADLRSWLRALNRTSNSWNAQSGVLVCEWGGSQTLCVAAARPFS